MNNISTTNNLKNKPSSSIAILKNLNEFKSQSAKEHSQFLENYYKNKNSSNINHELRSNIVDLNRDLTDKLTIKDQQPVNSPSHMNSLFSASSSMSSYLKSNFNKFFKHSYNSNSSSGIDVLENSIATSSKHDSNNEEQISTIDADSVSYQEDADLSLSTSPCPAITSNRLDKIGSSFNLENNNEPTESNRRPSNSIKINNNNNNRKNSNDDFTFVSFFIIFSVLFNNFFFELKLPDDRNVEKFSIMSYEVLSKSEGIHLDSTVHIKEFTHSKLEDQMNSCVNCGRKIQSVKKARRCYYYGKLYCKLCHLNFKYFIPAKVIKNLDTKKYPISEAARHILESVFRKPVFDIIYDNSDLYSQSSLLNECKKLRLELDHVRWYLQTCKNKIAKNQFIMHLWPDDYLYETIHLYSLFDLTNLKDIFNKLKLARDCGVSHILKECELCKQKGFICEICKRDETIYPFQIDSVEQWYVCYFVFLIATIGLTMLL